MTYRRFIYALLVIGLLACSYTALRRLHHERLARTVELVMDDADFQSLARSYNYDQTAFLVALRRAGLTSLAVAEELGGAVSSSGTAAVYPGATLLSQARLAGLTDPTLGPLARAGRIRPDEMYLLAYDAPTAERYAAQLRLKFPRSTQLLRAQLPAVWAIRTQSDYFANVALGIPADRIALAERLGLRLVPRLQNDEALDPPRIDALVSSATPKGSRARTVVFFGLRNAVLGYPNAIDAAAAALRAHKLTFGTIEVYDAKQLQSGNDLLAADLPDRTVRVQAIAKPEADKLRPEEIVQRYLLGARERNVRVIYLRPFAHQWGTLSIEATNAEIVRRIADGLRHEGLFIGTASPFERFIVAPWTTILASLAVPGVILLLLAWFGRVSWRWAAVIVALDVLFLAGGYAVHRDYLARDLIALAGAIAFAVAGFVAIAPAFSGRRAPRAAILEGLRVLAVATAVTLGGVLVIVGLVSSPLAMLEVERFTGVKVLLVVPPLVMLGLYFFSARFNARVSAAEAAEAPIRLWWAVAGVVLAAAAYLVLVRSGNQSDIAPSSAELALRAHLTSLLSVRPRTKEFLVGFPALMLVPVLLPGDRVRWGWLLALAIGIGLGDVADTFSHVHTPLLVSLLRLVNGAVLGIAIGAILAVVYRRWRRV